VVLLASVLGLSAADQATVGAVATQLERALGVGNFQIGLLVTVSTGVGAVAALPAGVLADRVKRTRLLVITICLWVAAMVASAVSVSYLWLLFSRLALGAVVAVAGPAVGSLTGDLFPVSERGRIYGFILTGELVGAALGVLISGDVAAAAGWRAAFGVLAVPGLALAVAIWAQFPEPARSGRSRLPEGAEHIVSAEEAADTPAETDAGDPTPSPDGNDGTGVAQEVQEEGIDPRQGLVLTGEPAKMSLWDAVRYVLRIPTNLLLIVASALGYFYFSGLRTFAVEFLRGRFGLGQGAATNLFVAIGLGAIIGVLVAGRLADHLLARRQIDARIVVAGGAFLVAAGLFLPGLVLRSLALAVPLFFIGAAGLGGANPPLDAARLDIMHSRLWGRAEAVRTLFRSSLVAAAPLLFGFVSTQLGGRTSGLGHPTGPLAPGAPSLDLTFLVMLIPLAAAGIILLRARRTYPRDVATAIASEHATRGNRAEAGIGRDGDV
jgi:predicted MFS family arabinose efflux permease